MTWLLSLLGVVNKSFLRKYRRHAVVIIVIAAAIITPTGDPFTLSVVAIPLYLLYEMSILMIKDKKEVPELEEEEEERRRGKESDKPIIYHSRFPSVCQKSIVTQLRLTFDTHTCNFYHIPLSYGK